MKSRHDALKDVVIPQASRSLVLHWGDTQTLNGGPDWLLQYSSFDGHATASLRRRSYDDRFLKVADGGDGTLTVSAPALDQISWSNP